MSLYYDNKQNRIYVRRNTINNRDQQIINSGNRNRYFNNTNSRINLNNNDNNNSFNQQMNEINNIVNEENNNSNDNLVEMSISDFLDKFNSNQNNVIEGPRGLPGLRGPQGEKGIQGPPGNSYLDENTAEELKLLLKDYHNKSFKNVKSLLYGIKKTNITETVNNKYSSSSYFKIMKNNHIGNNVVFDTFYLSPNVLEINEHSSNNFIHDKKVEKFVNVFKKSDYQYFPVDYIPTGFPINIKNNHSRFNNIIINNLSWNIIQNINESKYESTNILGIVPNIYEFLYKNISLTLNFELHSQIPLQLLSSNENIIPYRNNNVKVLNPSKTCLFEIKNFKVDNLNGFSDESIKIPIKNYYNLFNTLLCIRISIDDDEVYNLKGYNNNQKLTYGYIPLNQIILNFDYYLE